MEDLATNELVEKLSRKNIELLNEILELNKTIVDLKLELYNLKSNPAPLTYPPVIVPFYQEWWKEYPITTICQSTSFDGFVGMYTTS